MEAIHYISDFVYFSGRKVGGKYGNVLDALRAHIKYISRKTDGVLTFNLNPKNFLNKAKNEITKRWDSRVALKFVMALPLETNEKNAEKVVEKLKTFISQRLNVSKENIGIAVHLHKGISGNYNPHAHILIFPKTKDGKKLRLNRKDLSEFHRKWQALLREIGFDIRKDPEDERLPHLGQRLYYDKEAQELYRLYLEMKREEKRLEEIRKAVKREQVNRELHRRAPADAGAVKEGRERKEDFRAKQRNALRLHFKRLGYNPDDKLAVVLVNHRNGTVKQRVWTVKELLSDKVIAFLSKMNVEGYSVYASINTLKPSATRRKKEDFEPKQKRIYLDLDSKELSPRELVVKLFKYLRDNGLPQPTHIVKSSKGNYQVYWLLDESVDWQKLERIMEKMNNDLGLDHTQDVSRVFRLPYFRNKKPGKDDLVLNIDALRITIDGKEELLKATGKPVSLEPFRKLLSQSKDLGVEEEENPFTPKPPSPTFLPSQRQRQLSRSCVSKPKPVKRKLSTVEDLIAYIVSLVERDDYANRLAKGLMSNYGYELARYYALIKGILRLGDIPVGELFKEVEVSRKLMEHFAVNVYGLIADHLDLILEAFKNNKRKTPSEVDMAIAGLGVRRGVNLEELGELLTVLAFARGKRQTLKQAEEYARLTVQRAYENYMRYLESLEAQGVDWDNDDDDDFDFSP
jgi:hypothetical protein